MANPDIWKGKKVFIIATMGLFSGDGAGILARPFCRAHNLTQKKAEATARYYKPLPLQNLLIYPRSGNCTALRI